MVRLESNFSNARDTSLSQEKELHARYDVTVFVTTSVGFTGIDVDTMLNYPISEKLSTSEIKIWRL